MRRTFAISCSQLARILIWALVLGVAFSTGTQGQTHLGDFTTSFRKYSAYLYADGSYYWAIVPVDMDQDGVMELLAGRRNPNPDVVEIWDYDQSVECLQLVDTIFGFPYDIHDLAPGDFDHDGDIDIAVTLRSGGLYVAINQALPYNWCGGGWDVKSIHRRYGWQTIVADFDDDGNLDIFHGTDYHYISIFYGDGLGAFAPGPAPPSVPGSNYNAARGFTATDLNGDSRADLIGLPSERFPPLPSLSYLRAYLNSGSPGTISWSPTIAPMGPPVPPPAFVCQVSNGTADFNHDGHIDQLTIVNDGRVSLFWGGQIGSNLTWTFDDTLGTVPAGYSVAVPGDLNDDSELDFIVEGREFDGLAVFVGDGTGSFSSEWIDLPYHFWSGFNSLNSGDIDGDGLTDIIAARWYGPGYTYGFVVLTSANHPPIANAGSDQMVEQESHEGTEVTLDGSGSTDPDSTEGTNDDIISFNWYEEDALLGNGEIIEHTFLLSSHTVTLVVVDSFGETDEDEVIILVQDTTPPTIHSVSASPDTLWPPNHKMVEVTVTVDAEDICDPSPVCQIVDVTSNEPINGPGDGNTEPDWEITGGLTVKLRAERAGGGTGRVYTVHVEYTDASGNTATATVDVTVPHDRGKGNK